jgi:excisionase family DNA binding protein
LIPIRDVADLLGGVSRSHVYELIGSGDLVAVHLGRRRMVVAASVVSYVDRLTGTAT